jgi:hypothetical protein
MRGSVRIHFLTLYNKVVFYTENVCPSIYCELEMKRAYSTYMSSVDRAVIPTANACCFPSAITAW